MKKIFASIFGTTFLTALLCCVNMPVQANEMEIMHGSLSHSAHDCCPDDNESQPPGPIDCIGHTSDDDGVKTVPPGIVKMSVAVLPHLELYSADISPPPSQNAAAPPLVLPTNEYTLRKTTIVLRT